MPTWIHIHWVTYIKKLIIFKLARSKNYESLNNFVIHFWPKHSCAHMESSTRLSTSIANAVVNAVLQNHVPGNGFEGLVVEFIRRQHSSCGCCWSKATGADGHAINNHEAARDLRHTRRHSQAVTPSHTSNLTFHLHVWGAVHTHSWPARCHSHTTHIIHHKGCNLRFKATATTWLKSKSSCSCNLSFQVTWSCIQSIANTRSKREAPCGYNPRDQNTQVKRKSPCSCNLSTQVTANCIQVIANTRLKRKSPCSCNLSFQVTWSCIQVIANTQSKREAPCGYNPRRPSHRKLHPNDSKLHSL